MFGDAWRNLHVNLATGEARTALLSEQKANQLICRIELGKSLLIENLGLDGSISPENYMKIRLLTETMIQVLT